MNELSYNYVYFDDNKNSFYRITLGDLYKHEGVFVENPLMSHKNAFVRFLYKAHNSGRINRVIKLPFKSIWNRFLFKNIFQNNKPICFVFASSLYRLRWVGYFDYLKKHYRNCKLVYCCRDLYSNYFEWYKGFNDDYVKKTFDLILEYDIQEVKKYGLTFYTDFESYTWQGSVEKEDKFDVVFIGAAKDRIDLILSVYELLIKKGLTCYFYITGADCSLKEKYPFIHFEKEWMPYAEVIKKTMQARCILEVVQGESSGWTARAMKAFMYNKKLITNSKAVTYTRFFDNKNVQFFSKAEDINVDYIKGRNIPDFKYNNEFSPISVIEYIDGLFTKKWDSFEFYEKWFDLKKYIDC